MNQHRERLAAIILLALLGGGIIAFLCVGVSEDGKLTTSDGGLIAAAFLSIREVVSKIEKVALGIRTPAESLEDE